ncbi:MAG: hypothetical protein ABSB79_10715 [Syntrophales bacterium]|jgi:hypothetical protein
MRKSNLYIVLVILIIGGCIAATLSLKASLPPGINIVSPDSSLPEEVKALSGKWSGRWNSPWSWDCIICVENVDKDSARVVHAWGEYTTRAGSCHCAPDWRIIQHARVAYSNGKATLEFTTPPYRPLQGVNPSHLLSGSRDPEKRRYLFSFTVDKNEPDIMVGDFLSAKNSPLSIRMKRIVE